MGRYVPVELYRYVAENAARDGLASLALVSRDFQFEAERLLYRHILHIFPPVTAQRRPDTGHLLNQPRVWEYIRSYRFSILEDEGDAPFARQALRSLLPNMTKLITLQIYASHLRSPALAQRWQSCGDLFEGCTFSLRSFSSVFELDEALASFLAKQSAITELTWLSNPAPSHFLPAEALPNLRSLIFRLHGLGPNWELLHFIAPGRPITHASGYFHSRDLPVLAESTGPLQYLQMLELGRNQIDEIARHLPNLEFLTNINLDDNEFQDLSILSNTLSKFKHLRTVVGRKLLQSDVSSQAEADAEGMNILSALHAKCPTLHRVRLDFSNEILVAYFPIYEWDDKIQRWLVVGDGRDLWEESVSRYETS